MIRYVVASDAGMVRNPGDGHYAFLIQTWEDGTLIAETGQVHAFSNLGINCAELTAVAEAIWMVWYLMGEAEGEYSPTITLYTDSQNVVLWLTAAYQIRDERVAEKVRQVQRAIADSHITVEWRHVRSHQAVLNDDGSKLNARVDRMIRDMRGR